MEYFHLGLIYFLFIKNVKKQIVRGLQSLHNLKIFHRDLKVKKYIFITIKNIFWQSANFFMNKDGFVKLGDMNVSKIAKKGLLYTQTGTPYYAR